MGNSLHVCIDCVDLKVEITLLKRELKRARKGYVKIEDVMKALKRGSEHFSKDPYWKVYPKIIADINKLESEGE